MHRPSISHPSFQATRRPSEGTRVRRGHIGFVVASSITLGLVLGLVLDMVVLAGSRETTITGAALLALASGFATLAYLSGQYTDQPQPWAWVPAVSFGVTGAAIAVLDPGDETLGLLGWIWPIVLLTLVPWMVRAAREKLVNWSRRALLYPAFAVLALVAVGGVFETVAATETNNPPAGRSYLVGDHSLYLRCTGSGAPTVVLFSGLSERTSSWAWVQRKAARHTRVCAFDRAGQGWSGGYAGRQDAHELSRDVKGLLVAAHVPGPYVLAGHSVGGPYALAYAMDFPEDVAGVALIDSATPHQFDLPFYPGFYSMWHRVSALLPSLARAGIVRVAVGAGFGAFPTADARALRAFGSSPRELRADRNEFAELPTVFSQTQALTSIGDKPLFVLTAGLGEQTGWSESQNELSNLSSNALHETEPRATHASLLEDERDAVASSHAIEAVVQAARSGRPIASQRAMN